jgi:hypothetical protein
MHFVFYSRRHEYPQYHFRFTLRVFDTSSILFFTLDVMNTRSIIFVLHSESLIPAVSFSLHAVSCTPAVSIRFTCCVSNTRCIIRFYTQIRWYPQYPFRLTLTAVISILYQRLIYAYQQIADLLVWCDVESFTTECIQPRKHRNLFHDYSLEIVLCDECVSIWFEYSISSFRFHLKFACIVSSLTLVNLLIGLFLFIFGKVVRFVAVN